MTLLFKQVFSLIKLLNSDKGTNQIATGVACGFILGMTPAFSLQTVLVILCLFFFRIQIGAALLTAAFFAIPAYLLDPLFHEIGSRVLEIEALQSFYTVLFNLPIVPLTRFYNSVVMGSGVVSIALFPAVFFVARWLILSYREKVMARFEKSALWKAMKATSFYQLYEKFEAFHG